MHCKIECFITCILEIFKLKFHKFNIPHISNSLFKKFRLSWLQKYWPIILFFVASLDNYARHAKFNEHHLLNELNWFRLLHDTIWVYLLFFIRIVRLQCLSSKIKRVFHQFLIEDILHILNNKYISIYNWMNVYVYWTKHSMVKYSMGTWEIASAPLVSNLTFRWKIKSVPVLHAQSI